MKRIFFAAALAIVAIGGAATSASALTVWNNAGTTRYVCSGGGTTCAAQIGDQTVYDSPSAPKNEVDPDDYAELTFISN